MHLYTPLSNAHPAGLWTSSSSKALNCVLPTTGVDESPWAQLSLTSPWPCPSTLPPLHQTHCQITLFLEGAVTWTTWRSFTFGVGKHIFPQETYFPSHIENRSWAINGPRILTQPLRKLFVNSNPLKLAIKVSYSLVSAGTSNSAMSSLFWNPFRFSSYPTLSRVHCNFLKGCQPNLHMVLQLLNHHR